MITARELAAVIWISLFVLWALTRSEIRSSLRGVLKSLLEPKILSVVVVYATYIAGWTQLGASIGLWDGSQLKETIIWFVVTGFPLLFKLDHAGKDDRFFLNAMLSVFAVSVFLDFFMNITTFHLALELVMLPLIVVLSLVSAVAGFDKKLLPAKRICAVLLIIIGFVLIAFTAHDIYRQRNELDYDQLLRSLALTIWLPIVALPFLYLFALAAGYELAFMHMKFGNNRQRPSFKTRMAVLLGLNLHVREVHAFAGKWPGEVASAPSFHVALQRVRTFRTHRAEQRAEERARQAKFRRYAGADGRDAEGKRLDQREFEATKAALRLIASSQESFYQNNRNRYRADVLDIVSSPRMPLSLNLPMDHGVHVVVRRDGKAWYAWRKTITGWTFAIGASTKPPDRWFYDGTNPPTGYPSTTTGWDHQEPDINAINWRDNFDRHLNS